MPSPAFADSAVQRYLDDHDVVVLSTLGPSGAPLAMPMWFVHDESALTMVSAPGLAKVRNLRRDPRVCVVAQGGTREAPTGVVLTGEIDFVVGDDRQAWGRRFAAKYRPTIEGIWGGTEIPDDRSVFTFRPTVTSAFGL
jgi:nitroimidazol reductase NimA-like FMN-containing flavoprotein (pyridoxamine 5'-phosphate oxidase superfamily)